MYCVKRRLNELKLVLYLDPWAPSGCCPIVEGRCQGVKGQWPTLPLLQKHPSLQTSWCRHCPDFGAGSEDHCKPQGYMNDIILNKKTWKECTKFSLSDEARIVSAWGQIYNLTPPPWAQRWPQGVWNPGDWRIWARAGGNLSKMLRNHCIHWIMLGKPFFAIVRCTVILSNSYCTIHTTWLALFINT